jgi:hypothetical protein
MILRHDGVLDIEARIVLETDDKQMIYMHWKGLRHGPKDVIDRLNRGEAVDLSTYYIAPRRTSRRAQNAILLAQPHFARLPPAHASANAGGRRLSGPVVASGLGRLC